MVAPVNRLRIAVLECIPAPLFSAIAGRAWSAVVAAIRSTVGDRAGLLEDPIERVFGGRLGAHR